MKRKYNEPSIRIEAFETEDIIATSAITVNVLKDDQMEVQDQVVEGFFND